MQKKSSSWMKENMVNVAAYGGLLFCIILFSIVTPIRGESIWSSEKLATLMSDVMVTAVMSVGAVFVYALGNMDISIGRQVGLYVTLMVLVANKTDSLAGGIILSLIISVGFAVLNGSLGILLNIHPIVPSVASMFVLIGVSSLTYTYLNTRNISLKTVGHDVFKSPVVMAITLILEIVVAAYLFRFTKFGKYAKALGANQICAQQSGISRLKFSIIAYMIMGFCVVLASVFQMGYTGAASDASGTGFEMNVIVALILGGMPLSGGMRSKISCAVVGALTFSLLDVGLPLIGVPTRMTFLIKAIIFLIVVLITCRKKNGVLPR